MTQRYLRCYAEGRPGEWEALCLDFDLAVQGVTLDDVQFKLARAIDEYLAYVDTLPVEERRRFLYRRVPLRVQAGMILRLLGAWLRQGDDDERSELFTRKPCPV